LSKKNNAKNKISTNVNVIFFDFATIKINIENGKNHPKMNLLLHEYA